MCCWLSSAFRVAFGMWLCEFWSRLGLVLELGMLPALRKPALGKTHSPLAWGHSPFHQLEGFSLNLLIGTLFGLVRLGTDCSNWFVFDHSLPSPQLTWNLRRTSGSMLIGGRARVPSISCWCSAGTEGFPPISHPLWFPLRESGLGPLLTSKIWLWVKNGYPKWNP